MLKAISEPMLRLPSKTSIAPVASTVICIVFSRPCVSTLAIADMRPTTARWRTPAATLSSHAVMRSGSIASDFTVRMPWIVSTR